MITYNDLKEKSKAIESKYNINHYEVLQKFMFERILERISISKYKNNFILKGGLLLSAIFGIDNRTTKDMDASIKGLNISKEHMLKVLNEILSINLNDGVKFNVVDITDIREDDEYGGNKYKIVAHLQNLKVNLDIDISTGDEITPKEIKYKYPLTFENRSILISSYNLETILAEKLETILRRGHYNTRMKDYYDIYLFLTKLKKEINVEIAKKAIENTFSKRDSLDVLNDYTQILDDILSYERIKIYWEKYTEKNKYAQGIAFERILEVIRNFLNEIEIVTISV